MQGSFEDIFNKLTNNLKKDVYYNDINELVKEYQMITLDDFIINDELVDIEILGESQINNINKDIENQIILFDVVQFLEKILKSYKFNVNKINLQFNMDFPRSDFYFNDVNYINKDTAIDLLNNFSKYNIIIYNHEITLTLLLLSLCTQASFAFSFMLMSKLYNDFNKEIYVTSNDIKYNIFHQKDLLNIKLNAIYNIKNIKINQNISKIKITTDIHMILKQNKCEICKFGIILWEIGD